MSSATLTAESVIELPPCEVYGLFGTSEAGGWLFEARCESMTVGAPVRLKLPIDGRAGQNHVDLLGWLAAVRPNSAIVIEHTQPWRGRLKLTFESLGPRRTQVRVRAVVSPTGVEWLVRRGGSILPVPPIERNAVRIGVVTSKSGPGATYSMATEYLAELAVQEVNESGGVDRQRLELLVADDTTDPAIAAVEARRLVTAGCQAVFACTTSASFAAINQEICGDDVLLVHAVMNERGTDGDGTSMVCLGERPDTQIAVSARRLMRETGARNWFLVGEDYIWSYGVHLAARGAIPRYGGRVIGESYTPVGTTDFSTVIERIERSTSDVVLSSLIGGDEVEFQRQCAAAGLRSQVSVLSLVLDEPTCEHIGVDASEGIWTASGYFEGVPVAGNSDLVRRYREACGRWSPPISTMSETVYEAILRYAQAVRHDDNARHRGRALFERCGGADGTAIGARDLVTPPLYLAEVRSGGLRIFDEVR